jgi:hypothetical protein
LIGTLQEARTLRVIVVIQTGNTSTDGHVKVEIIVDRKRLVAD